MGKGEEGGGQERAVSEGMSVVICVMGLESGSATVWKSAALKRVVSTKHKCERPRLIY